MYKRQLEAAAEQPGPFPHAHQTRPRPGQRRTGRRPVGADHGDLDPLRTVRQPQPDSTGRGVLEGVGERLLHDPVRRQLHRRGQFAARAVLGRLEVQARLPARRPDLGQQRVERVELGRLVRGLVAGPQQADHAAHLGQPLHAVLPDHRHRREQRVGGVALLAAGQRLGTGGVDGDGGEVVGDHVVQLAGHPGALGDHRLPAVQLGQQGSLLGPQLLGVGPFPVLAQQVGRPDRREEHQSGESRHQQRLGDGGVHQRQGAQHQGGRTTGEVQDLRHPARPVEHPGVEQVGVHHHRRQVRPGEDVGREEQTAEADRPDRPGAAQQFQPGHRGQREQRDPGRRGGAVVRAEDRQQHPAAQPGEGNAPVLLARAEAELGHPTISSLSGRCRVHRPEERPYTESRSPAAPGLVSGRPDRGAVGLPSTARGCRPRRSAWRPTPH